MWPCHRFSNEYVHASNPPFNLLSMVQPSSFSWEYISILPMYSAGSTEAIYSSRTVDQHADPVLPSGYWRIMFPSISGKNVSHKLWPEEVPSVLCGCRAPSNAFDGMRTLPSWAESLMDQLLLVLRFLCISKRHERPIYSCSYATTSVRLEAYKTIVKAPAHTRLLIKKWCYGMPVVMFFFCFLRRGGRR